ncbi:hypothetical protein Tcan_05939 [Toxocara canis]|uniref:Uncharacterized protein n=1 Tax=Toxocara canis TaxID=6265 RepID=A0A0B2VJ43_TOXCA|nr:hypothetical protein Tcan_05939 [Toxocara canis]
MRRTTAWHKTRLVASAFCIMAAENHMHNGNSNASHSAVQTGLQSMDLLRSLNVAKLFELTCISDDEFEKWLMSANLLPRSRFCECGCEMRVKRWRMRKAWRCKRKCCARLKGYYAGTFFHGAHVAVKEIFKLSYYWCVGTYSMDRVQQALRRQNGRTFSVRSIIDWYGFFRGVCAGYFRQNPVRLGGKGKEVVIEEVMVMQEQTRKIKRGREHWGFAGTESGSSARFIEEIGEDLNADSLFAMIGKYILPGSEVVSTLFKKYKYEDDEKVRDAYEHLATTNSLRFVDAKAGQREGAIGKIWHRFKCTHNKKLDERTVPSTHIKEFMWRRLFDGSDCMYNLWSQIASNYTF